MPLIIIDPNSDYVHLGRLMPREKVAMRGRPAMDESAYAALGEAMAAGGPVSVASAKRAATCRCVCTCPTCRWPSRP